MESTQPVVRVGYPISKILLAGVIAIALSIVANLIVRWVALLFVNVPADFMPLATIQPILIFTTLFIAVATLVWFIVTRASRAPERTWNWVVLIGFVVSIIPDLLMPSMAQPVPGMGTFTWSAALVLISLHVVSGLITWWALPRFSRA